MKLILFFYNYLAILYCKFPLLAFSGKCDAAGEFILACRSTAAQCKDGFKSVNKICIIRLCVLL